jgi:iron(III) transport system substrate-binding protein
MRLLVALALGSVACKSEPPNEVVVYTSVDQVFSEPVLRAFEKQSGIKVRAVFDTEETKSTGVLNRLIAEASSPQADVFWSGDPVRPFLLIGRGLVEPYSSPAAAKIPLGFKATDGTWTGFAARARVLLVNTELVPAEEMPESIRDLADPKWKGKTAIANPLFGTTTMHAAALVSAWGEERTKEFFESLKSNEVRVASSNGEVKRLVSSKEIAFGLTDTDDANEAVKSGAKVAMVYPEETLVMPTTAVIMKGGPHPANARKLIDFLLSAECERMMAENGAHMPLGSDVVPPAGMKRVGEIDAMRIDYRAVGDAMEQSQPWLRSWVGVQ